MRALDLSGMRFGLLTAIERSAPAKSGKAQWRCVCDCGNTSVVQTSNLTSGHTKSCGCQQTVAMLAMTPYVQTKHGMCYSKTYSTWSGMRDRCLNSTSKYYKYYGARGITVCERWNDFSAFLQDMGQRPDGKTLDRIDVNGNYEPGNCRWATPKEQARNRRNNRIVDGVCMAEAAEKHGVKYTTFKERLNRQKVAA